MLDELHTYRGRQGADVAMLVRRVRDRLCPDHPPVCIGTLRKDPDVLTACRLVGDADSAGSSSEGRFR